ncbi:thioester domain-containing protein [Nocardioides humi]|uniref:thioester domain-containing protein n=1 Tax=Nocardioides humi TaxID=449461 RepID=UPI0011286C1F|nr:thioester domain-containing protein [Nocardioides humi]
MRMSNGRRTGVAALALAVVAVLTPWSAPGASAEPGAGDTVYVGAKSQGYPGSGIHGVFEQTPADPGNPGTPDYWAYCIEHDVTAKPNIAAGVGTASDFLGSNHFTDPAVQARVLWVLAHSYPALSLADFATASGVPGIALNDAIEATQYAIWRYTDVGYDASWAWASDDSEDAYWYLVNGANASGGLTPRT